MLSVAPGSTQAIVSEPTVALLGLLCARFKRFTTNLGGRAMAARLQRGLESNLGSRAWMFLPLRQPTRGADRITAGPWESGISPSRARSSFSISMSRQICSTAR